MTIHVQFHSYFKDLTGCADTRIDLPHESSVGDLHQLLMQQFPRLAEMKKSTLIAVGVEYQDARFILQDQDHVSFFPPVQGG